MSIHTHVNIILIFIYNAQVCAPYFSMLEPEARPSKHSWALVDPVKHKSNRPEVVWRCEIAGFQVEFHMFPRVSGTHMLSSFLKIDLLRTIMNQMIFLVKVLGGQHVNKIPSVFWLRLFVKSLQAAGEAVDKMLTQDAFGAQQFFGFQETSWKTIDLWISNLSWWHSLFIHFPLRKVVDLVFVWR